MFRLPPRWRRAPSSVQLEKARSLRPKGRSYRPRLEVFEERTLPATVFWTNPAGGDWAVPGNWSTGQLPGPDDDVVIDVPGAITVTHSAGTDSVRSLTSAETLAHSGGSLTLTEASVLNNTFLLSFGTLAGPGRLTVNDLFTWTGGTLAGTGQTVANGGLVISEAADKVLDGRRLENVGTATWTAGTLVLANGAAVHNLAGATFRAAAGTAVVHRTPGATPAFHNLGGFISTRATTFDGVLFHNTGNVLVSPEAAEDIALTLKGGGTSTGRFQVNARGTLHISAGMHSLLPGSSVVGIGDVEFSDDGRSLAVVTIAGTYNVTGNTILTFRAQALGANVSFLGGATLARLTLEGGTLGGPGTVTVTDTLTWTGGRQSGPGRTLSWRSMTIAGTVAKSLSGRTLDNAGTVTWTGSDLNASRVDFFGPSVFNNLSGATFDAQANAAFGGFPVHLESRFNNAGTLRRSSAPGTSTFTTPLTNTGRIDVDGGTLRLSATGTFTGPTTVAEGAALEFASSLHHFLPGSRLSGEGTVRFVSDATVRVEGDYAVTGESLLGGAWVQFQRDVTFNRLTLQAAGPSRSVLEVTGNVTINGLLTWSSGLMRGPGRTRANGGVVGGNTDLVGRTFDNVGQADWGGASLNLEDGAVFNNLAESVFAVTSQGTLRIMGSGVFNNLGTFVLRGGNVEATTTFNNSGVLDGQSGRVTLNGSSLNTGLYVVGRFRFGSGVHNVAAGARVTGTGILEYEAAQSEPNLTNISGEYDVGTTVIGRATVNFLVDAQTTDLQILGNTLYTTGTLTVRDRVTWSGGTFGGPGVIRVMDRLVGFGGTLTTGRIEVAGAVSLEGGNYTFGNAGVLSVLPGASMEVQYDSRINASAGLSPRIVNAGTLRKTRGTGLITFNGVALENHGTVEVQEGTLSLSGGSSNSGYFLVPGSNTLLFNSGRHTLGPTTRVSGAGTVRFANDRNVSGSTIILEGNLETTGPVSVSNTTLELRRDTRVAALTLAGNITGPANLIITGLLTWTTGTMNGPGQTLAEGGMTVGGDLDSRFVLDGRRFDNAGVAAFAPVRDFVVRNGAVFTNRAGATFEIQSAFTPAGGADSLFHNLGLIRYARPGSANWAIPLQNSGTLEVQSGHLEFRTQGVSSGVITIAQGATLELDAGFVLGPTSRTTSQGSLVLRAGLTVNGVFDVSSVTGVYNSSLLVESNARIADASLADATISASAVLTVTNTISWSSLRGPGRVVFTGRVTWFGMAAPVLDGVTFDNAGTIIHAGTSANAGLVARNGAILNNLAGATFEIQRQGRFRWDLVGAAPQFNNAGLLRRSISTAVIEFSIAFANAGVLEVQTGTLDLIGPFTNFSGTTLTGGRYLVQGTPRFNNADVRTSAATLTLDGPAARIVNQSGGDALLNLAANAPGGQFILQNGSALATVSPFQNAGTVVVSGGSVFQTVASYTQTDGLTYLDGGILISNSIVDLAGGFLTGSGVIGGNVVNRSWLDVGGWGTAGYLVITGNYTQTADALLTLELGDTPAGNSDELLIAGTATVDGTLSVGLLDDFVAREGDVFLPLVAGAGLTGRFARLDLPDLGPEFFLEAFHDPAALVLTVSRRP